MWAALTVTFLALSGVLLVIVHMRLRAIPTDGLSEGSQFHLRGGQEPAPLRLRPLPALQTLPPWPAQGGAAGAAPHQADPRTAAARQAALDAADLAMQSMQSARLESMQDLAARSMQGERIEQGPRDWEQYPGPAVGHDRPPGLGPPAAEPTKAPWDNCRWEMHRRTFLGEFAEGLAQAYSAPEARARCLAHPECLGVTCEREDFQCSPRLGRPYLADSPADEVSYTRHCPGDKVATRPPVVAGDYAIHAALPDLSKARRAGARAPLEPGQLVVVVLAHDRVDCLEKCLESLARQQDADLFAHAVSLDDPASYPKMESVARRFMGKLPLDVWHKGASPPRTPTVVKISEHFRFVLKEVFENRQFPFAVFLENDLRVAPDFLSYFRSTAWLLEEDPTLFCVSAWNDNGFKGLVSDERRLFRTDYFPGLGWMVRNDTWTLIRGQWPRFPSTGWDHWLRHGSGLRPRECVVPEVSRTHHFSDSGANIHRGSGLAKMLAGMVESKLRPGELGDVGRMMEAAYEEDLQALARSATLAQSGDLVSLPGAGTYLVPYVREEYANIARQLTLSPAQPRTAHRGVIITRHPKSGARVLLADRRLDRRLLPENERWEPDPQRRVAKADPGESCDGLCGRLGMRCDAEQLEWVNACEALRREFPCESGCGHQVGKEIPCYVHDRSRDTSFQCLVTDDAMPACGAAIKATTRLCACVPR